MGLKQIDAIDREIALWNKLKSMDGTKQMEYLLDAQDKLDSAYGKIFAALAEPGVSLGETCRKIQDIKYREIDPIIEAGIVTPQGDFPTPKPEPEEEEIWLD